MIAGQLMRVTSRRTFKIAIVIDPVIRTAGGDKRTRIAVWTANGQRWSRPLLVRSLSLVPLVRAAQSSAHRRVIDAAAASLSDTGFLHYKDGGCYIGAVTVK